MLAYTCDVAVRIADDPAERQRPLADAGQHCAAVAACLVLMAELLDRLALDTRNIAAENDNITLVILKPRLLYRAADRIARAVAVLTLQRIAALRERRLYLVSHKAYNNGNILVGNKINGIEHIRDKRSSASLAEYLRAGMFIIVQSRSLAACHDYSLHFYFLSPPRGAQRRSIYVIKQSFSLM